MSYSYTDHLERVRAYSKTPEAKNKKAIARKRRASEKAPSGKWVKVKAKPLLIAMALWR